MSIKYKNYEIIKEDERNWKLVRHDQAVAERDICNPKTREVIHKKGDQYQKDTFKGFFGTLSSAGVAIFDDLLGRDCTSLEEVIAQAKALRKDIAAKLAFKAV